MILTFSMSLANYTYVVCHAICICSHEQFLQKFKLGYLWWASQVWKGYFTSSTYSVFYLNIDFTNISFAFREKKKSCQRKTNYSMRLNHTFEWNIFFKLPSQKALFHNPVTIDWVVKIMLIRSLSKYLLVQFLLSIRVWNWLITFSYNSIHPLHTVTGTECVVEHWINVACFPARLCRDVLHIL